jgi:glycosyltransferase involved in cell wall biosynthesis
MKKIYFVYETTQTPYGGINSFNRALKQALAENPSEGFCSTDTAADADLIFLSAASRGPTAQGRDRSIKPWQLRNLKARRWIYDARGFFNDGQFQIPVVHRLDGLTLRYGRQDGQAYDDLQIALNGFSARTIFQSRFCLESFRGLSAPLASDTVIPNGANGKIFTLTSRAPLGTKLRLIAASWSSNLNKGHAAYAALSMLPDVEMTFIGRWAPSVPAANVRIIAPCAQNDMARLYAQADAFVHMAAHDPAPNVVTEALATGLPILYFKSGGTGEIAVHERYGIGIDNLSQESLKFGIGRLRASWLELTGQIAANRRQFLADFAYERYAQVFRNMLMARL